MIAMNFHKSFSVEYQRKSAETQRNRDLEFFQATAARAAIACSHRR